jgi:hypothetical protein
MSVQSGGPKALPTVGHILGTMKYSIKTDCEERPCRGFIGVCSTFSDLSQEREAVLDAIRRLKLQHDSMEFLGARAEQPIEICLEEVRASDVLVVIVSHRYGSIVPELGISYSEAEYSEGFRLRKPCLVYSVEIELRRLGSGRQRGQAHLPDL